MLQFTNFIRDSGDILADGGIAIILDSALYDLESVYNQAFQEYQTLSPVQVRLSIKLENILPEAVGTLHRTQEN